MALSHSVRHLVMALALVGCSGNGSEPPPGGIVDCASGEVIFFDRGSTTLPQKSRAYLSAGFLSEGRCVPRVTDPRSKVFVCVAGHTDAQEARTLDRRLSLRRAEAVADFLIELGVPREHIIVRGQADGQPLAKAPPGAAELQNRFVEIAWQRNPDSSFCD